MQTKRRYSEAPVAKSTGSTYTPESLANFVASQMIQAFEMPVNNSITVLDPAMGDGALLDALIRKIPSEQHNRLQVTGFEIDYEAVAEAEVRLRHSYPQVEFSFEKRDFLEFVTSKPRKNDLFAGGEPIAQFDLVIANPPYVRTQIMGSEHAQRLSKQFDLSGRVDLYYPFLLAISEVLSSKGIAGVITSNRFITTKSGQAVRRALLSQFEILHCWDLGDTKLFEAAVLPAVILARGGVEKTRKQSAEVKYSSIYQTNEEAVSAADSALLALSEGDKSIVAISDGRRFRIRHGVLNNGGNPDGIWRVATKSTDRWLATVESHTWRTFKSIGRIRVGVKSTADKVFVRSDWDELPGGRPEILRPLITRRCAQRYRGCTPIDAKDRKEILYPHEVHEGIRRPVDLSKFPVSARYLELHREQLSARKYVLEAGRRWYELWVPQDPEAWAAPKLVFPDISEKPIFWIDLHGAVVNGECYWMNSDLSGNLDHLWLALAIANSSFIEEFYDHRFNNKLYAGRRRFITQYVEQFPLPDPGSTLSEEIVLLAKSIHSTEQIDQVENIEREIDAKVWKSFGLPVKKSTR